MSKSKKTNHKENMKRAADFNQKLLDGDDETMEKLFRVCTDLDEDDHHALDEKLAGAITVASALFDANTLKSLDCKFVPEYIYGIIPYSVHVAQCQELDCLTSEDGSILFYPEILTLDDGSAVRLIVVDDEGEEDEEDIDLNEENIDDDEFNLGDDNGIDL